MKILIVGLVSLIVLTACVHNPQKISVRSPTIVDVKDDKDVPPPGFNQFCKAKKGVLVVYVTESGNATARPCPGISLEPRLPDDVDQSVGLPTALGITQKWKSSKNPDPCAEYVIGGYSRFYCWGLPK